VPFVHAFDYDSSMTQSENYTLATGKAAARRLHILHRVCSPVARRVLAEAGLAPGMSVADFGCGVGATTRMLAEMVGPTGHVTGIDMSAAQLEEARGLCEADGIQNATFVEASAYDTGLPRDSFDLAYCRFLLLHLTDPARGLREMRDVLKPGGLLVVEDGNLMAAGSEPRSGQHWFPDLFGRLGPMRGVDYGVADRLFHLVRDAGFPKPDVIFHQPAAAYGEDRLLLQLSVEEIGPACVESGLLTEDELKNVLAEMQVASDDPDVLVMMPRMSLVWARKP